LLLLLPQARRLALNILSWLAVEVAGVRAVAAVAQVDIERLPGFPLLLVQRLPSQLALAELVRPLDRFQAIQMRLEPLEVTAFFQQ